MRHRKSGRHLNRTSSHRRAMFRNMAVSLIRHELIKTTVAKAKELRRVVEPLVTLAKQDTLANRRLAFARTRSAQAVAKLFAELGPRYGERPGGYTRILKCGYRSGDAASMAYIELVGRLEAAGPGDEDADEAAPPIESAPMVEAGGLPPPAAAEATETTGVSEAIAPAKPADAAEPAVTRPAEEGGSGKT